MDETTKLKIMEECPRFISCSATKCPLDVDIKLRMELPEDEKCTMEKNVRLKIGKKYKLSKLGLTNAEYAGRLAWDNKPEKEKAKVISRVAKFAFKKQAV